MESYEHNSNKVIESMHFCSTSPRLQWVFDKQLAKYYILTLPSPCNINFRRLKCSKFIYQSQVTVILFEQSMQTLIQT